MDISEYKKDFDDIIDGLRKELGGLIVHRASPALVESILIDYYGKLTQLTHIAAISSPDAHTLIIKPWETEMLGPIAKAITQSDIGVQPVAQKDFIRISLPPLSEERREMLRKLIQKKTEEARIKIRIIRDNIWKEIQKAEKNKEISEDEKFSSKEKLEDMVKEINQTIEEIHVKKVDEFSI